MVYEALYHLSAPCFAAQLFWFTLTVLISMAFSCSTQLILPINATKHEAKKKSLYWIHMRQVDGMMTPTGC